MRTSNCCPQIRFCALNCDLQIRCSIPILNAVFSSFPLQTSNCCLQIRFCALNCDVQIVIYKSDPLGSCTQSLTWVIVGLVTEFSPEKDRDQNGGWKVFWSCSLSSHYSHRTQVFTTNYCDSETKQTKRKPKWDVWRQNDIFPIFCIIGRFLPHLCWASTCLYVRNLNFLSLLSK